MKQINWPIPIQYKNYENKVANQDFILIPTCSGSVRATNQYCASFLATVKVGVLDVDNILIFDTVSHIIKGSSFGEEKKLYG